jgi:hypothetical protein
MCNTDAGAGALSSAFASEACEICGSAPENCRSSLVFVVDGVCWSFHFSCTGKATMGVFFCRACNAHLSSGANSVTENGLFRVYAAVLTQHTHTQHTQTSTQLRLGPQSTCLCLPHYLGLFNKPPEEEEE